jgi:hypothetical protein
MEAIVGAIGHPAAMTEDQLGEAIENLVTVAVTYRFRRHGIALSGEAAVGAADLAATVIRAMDAWLAANTVPITSPDEVTP